MKKKILIITAAIIVFGVCLYFFLRKREKDQASIDLRNILDFLKRKPEPEDLAGETRPIIPK